VIRETPALVTALGGGILLIALLSPIAWFHEEATGGIAGEGAGQDRTLDAWEAFGAWVIAIAVPAAAAIANLPARRLGQGLPWALSLGLVLLGLAILVVVSSVELSDELPPCCDLAYVRPSPRAGLLIGSLGALLLLGGTLAAWPGRERAESHSPPT